MHTRTNTMIMNTLNVECNHSNAYCQCCPPKKSQSFIINNESPKSKLKLKLNPKPKANANAKPKPIKELSENEQTNKFIHSLTSATLRYLDKNEKALHSVAEESVFIALGYNISIENETKLKEAQIETETELSNLEKLQNKYNKEFLNKINKLRIEHIMRYRDAIRAFRINEIFNITKKQHPTFSRCDIVLNLSAKADLLYLPTPSPPPPTPTSVHILNRNVNETSSNIKQSNNINKCNTSKPVQINLEKRKMRLNNVKYTIKSSSNPVTASCTNRKMQNQNNVIRRNKEYSPSSQIYISINDYTNNKINSNTCNQSITNKKTKINLNNLNNQTIGYKYNNKIINSNTNSNISLVSSTSTSMSSSSSPPSSSSSIDYKTRFVLMNNDNNPYYNAYNPITQIVSYSNDPVLQKIAKHKNKNKNKKSRKRKFTSIDYPLNPIKHIISQSQSHKHHQLNDNIHKQPPKKRSKIAIDNRLRMNRHKCNRNNRNKYNCYDSYDDEDDDINQTNNNSSSNNNTNEHL